MSILPLQVSATVKEFSVSVPVLSVQKTSTPPRSSTADSLFTMTLRLAKTRALWERAKVVTRGKASGITPTVRAIEKSKSSLRLKVPLRSKALAKNTNAKVTAINFKIKAENSLIPFSKLLMLFVAVAKCAILPIAVLFPVFTTIALAVPFTTKVPEKPTFSASKKFCAVLSNASLIL